MVEALSIWSRGSGAQEWVTQFSVAHSENGQTWDWLIDPLDYYHGSVRRSDVTCALCICEKKKSLHS